MKIINYFFAKHRSNWAAKVKMLPWKSRFHRSGSTSQGRTWFSASVPFFSKKIYLRKYIKTHGLIRSGALSGVVLDLEGLGNEIARSEEVSCQVFRG